MDVKSLSKIKKKKTSHASADVKGEFWYEDRLPGDGRPKNAFNAIYDSTLSLGNETDESANKSWFDMVEEDEALNNQLLDKEAGQNVCKDYLGIQPGIKVKKEIDKHNEHNMCKESIGLPPGVKIKEEKVEENEDKCPSDISHLDRPVTSEMVTTQPTVVIKQEKDCAIAKQPEMTTKVSNKQLQGGICNTVNNKKEVRIAVKLEKQTEAECSTQKLELNCVNIVVADSVEQHPLVKEKFDGKGRKLDSSLHLQQEASTLSKKSYAAMVSKHGINDQAIIKQEASPKETASNNISGGNKEPVKSEHEQGKKTTHPEHKHKAGTGNQRGKKIKQEHTIDSSTDSDSSKYLAHNHDKVCGNAEIFSKPDSKRFKKEEDSEALANISKNRKRTLDSSSESLNLKRERTGSSSSGSTNSLQQKREYEKDPEVLARRQKQIDYGKNTVGYDNYKRQVPKELRTSRHPRTPPKHIKYSRRGWDGTVRIWRQQLHMWDPASETGEAVLFDSASEMSGEAGSITSDDISDTNQQDDYLNLDHDNLDDLIY